VGGRYRCQGRVSWYWNRTGFDDKVRRFILFRFTSLYDSWCFVLTSYMIIAVFLDCSRFAEYAKNPSYASACTMLSTGT
jgi:hypothetical protein